MSTSLDITAARAQILAQELAVHPEVGDVHQLRQLSRFRTWVPSLFDEALDRAIDDGTICQDAHGRLIAGPLEDVA